MAAGGALAAVFLISYNNSQAVAGWPASEKPSEAHNLQGLPL